MQDQLFKKYIICNKNLDTLDTTNLKLFTDSIAMTCDWYKQGDYISISSVRLNDFLDASNGFITYTTAGSNYTIQF